MLQAGLQHFHPSLILVFPILGLVRKPFCKLYIFKYEIVLFFLSQFVFSAVTFWRDPTLLYAMLLSKNGMVLQNYFVYSRFTVSFSHLHSANGDVVFDML